MNWKQEAAEKLADHRARKTALENLTTELRRLEEEAVALRSAGAHTNTPVRTSAHAAQDRTLNNLAAREELRRARQAARALVAQVDSALAALDEQERLLLEGLYIHRAKGNVQRLCEQLNVEQSTLYRRRDAALRQFTIALYGVC